MPLCVNKQLLPFPLDEQASPFEVNLKQGKHGRESKHLVSKVLYYPKKIQPRDKDEHRNIKKVISCITETNKNNHITQTECVICLLLG